MKGGTMWLHGIIPFTLASVCCPTHTKSGTCPCADTMSDAKEQVKTATTAALTATFAINGNRDITQFLPALIGCIARPVGETVVAP